MKKLFLGIALMLTAMLTLVSCGGDDSNNGKTFKADFVQIAKDNALDRYESMSVPSKINANNTYRRTMPLKSVERAIDTSKYAVSTLYSIHSPFVKIRDLTTDKYGIFSYASNTAIIPTNYKAINCTGISGYSSSSYAYYTVVTCVLEGETEDVTTYNLYDSEGNAIITNSEKAIYSVEFSEFDDTEENQEYALEKFICADSSEIVFKYDLLAKTRERYTESPKNSDVLLKNFFADITLVGDYKIEIVENEAPQSTINVYKEEKLITSYLMPMEYYNSDSIRLFETSLLLVTIDNLPNDAEEYSYSNGEYKYDVTCSIMNLLDGSIDKISLPFGNINIASDEALKNTEKEEKYLLLSGYGIKDNKTLDQIKSYFLVNEEGAYCLMNESTIKYYDGLYKCPTGYFSMESDEYDVIFYDEELNITGILNEEYELHEINPFSQQFYVYNSEKSEFIWIDSSGNVLTTPSEYDETYYVNGYYIYELYDDEQGVSYFAYQKNGSAASSVSSYYVEDEDTKEKTYFTYNDTYGIFVSPDGKKIVTPDGTAFETDTYFNYSPYGNYITYGKDSKTYVITK